MTASLPATPDPRVQTVLAYINDPYAEFDTHPDSVMSEALAALASLATELAATRQALEQAEAILLLERFDGDSDVRRVRKAARAVVAGEDTT